MIIGLEQFIVSAKANGWVGSATGGKKVPAARLGSYDIVYDEGDFHYRDSFVGFSDFCGQEHVTFKGEPVWSMAYYGYLLQPKIFSGQDAVKVLEKALGKLYQENRFLGGFFHAEDNLEYRDMNFGDYQRFHGVEKIIMSGKLVYELLYFGGEVRK